MVLPPVLHRQAGDLLYPSPFPVTFLTITILALYHTFTVLRASTFADAVPAHAAGRFIRRPACWTMSQEAIICLDKATKIGVLTSLPTIPSLGWALHSPRLFCPRQLLASTFFAWEYNGILYPEYDYFSLYLLLARLQVSWLPH